MRDALGKEERYAPLCVSVPSRSTVWESMGERKNITYPSGNKAIYEYDEML